jgi:hypothetical protein
VTVPHPIAAQSHHVLTVLEPPSRVNQYRNFTPASWTGDVPVLTTWNPGLASLGDRPWS